MLTAISELNRTALNLAVAAALGRNMVWLEHTDEFGEIDPEDTIAYDPLPDYSGSWAQGGPLAQKLQMSFEPQFAFGRVSSWVCRSYAEGPQAIGEGPDQLTAAMRCFAAYHLGLGFTVPEQAL